MSDLKSLQSKASDFFHQYQKKYTKEMKCSHGCSDCCYTSITIMPWEADLIEKWFLSLNESEKSKVYKSWLHLKNQNRRKIVFGHEEKACAFLDTDQAQCTIYDARPTICRTQGMAMQWQEGEVIKRSWCDHNFEGQHSPSSDDDLNLDTLNLMISKAQMIWEEKEGQKTRQTFSRIPLEHILNKLIAQTQKA